MDAVVTLKLTPQELARITGAIEIARSISLHDGEFAGTPKERRDAKAHAVLYEDLLRKLT